MATDFRLKDQLPKLTERIVRTYDDVGKINHLGHCPLPNYDEIITATDELTEILYPGYRRREGLHRGNVGLLRRRARRPAARSAHHADRPRTPPRSRASTATPTTATRRRTTKPSARRRRCCSSNAFPSCAPTSPPTSRPPTTATRPASRSTK